MSYRYLKPTILFLFSFFSTCSFAASFDGRQEFIAHSIQGSLQLTCQEGFERDFVIVNCSEAILEPFETAYFWAETDTGADRVKLMSLRGDGTTVTKEVSYNSKLGRSETRVNLWILTLFQTPLLDVGTNSVGYELIKDDQVLSQGQFEVSVKLGAARTCSSGSALSSIMNDCRYTYPACMRYFQSRNWCQ